MSVRNAIAWSILGRAFSYCFLFVGSVIVARLLTPHDMGVFAVALATIAIINIFLNFDVGSYVVRAQDLQISTIESAFTVNAILATSGGALIFAFSVIERHIFGNPDVARVLMPLALVPIIGIADFLPSMMLRRQMNFKLLATIESAVAILRNGTTIALAFAGFSYMSLAYGNLAAAIASAITINTVAGHHRRFRVSFVEGRAIMAFGLRMLSIGGAGGIAMRLSEIAMGQILGLAALGLYSRASSISTLVLDNIYGSISRVVFVRLSEEARTKGSIREISLLSFELTTAALWPIQLGLAVLSGPAIYYLYGERWLAAALPLSLLMLAHCISLSFSMSWELFVIKGEARRQVKLELIRVFLGAAFFVIGCFINIVAAAAARIAEAIVGYVLYRPHMERLTDARSGVIPRMLVRNAGLAIIAVLPAFLLMIWTEWSHRTSPAMLAGSVLLGSIMWLFALSRQAHPLYHELQKVTSKVLHKRTDRSNIANP